MRKPLGGPRDRRHGSISAYLYWNCRCEKCRTAYSEQRLRAVERGNVVTHGTYGYTLGCRCEKCVADKRVLDNRMRANARRREKLYATAAGVDMGGLA